MAGSDVHRGFAHSRFGPLHFRAAGVGDTLLLIPQSGRSSRMYLSLIAALSGRYRVISFDLPGSGDSVALPRPATLAALADALVDGLEELSVTRFHAFGLHAGNKVAAALAVGHPDRVGRLVLAGQSHSIVPDNDLRAEAFMTVPAVRALFAEDDGAATASPAWITTLRAAIEERLEQEIAAAGTAGPRDRHAVVAELVESLQSQADLRAFYGATLDYDMATDLTQIRAPTLVLEIVSDREDHAIGRQGEALLGLIPNAALREIAHRATVATLEDRASQVAEIVDEFLVG
jgi:pimeloyl-ACP methyl ester carboxylesterase